MGEAGVDREYRRAPAAAPPTQVGDATIVLARDGAATFTAPVENDVDAETWLRFRAEWETLPPDRYLPQGETYRTRRYGRVEATRSGEGWRLRPLAPAPFVQAADIVPLYGGKARSFAPISHDVLRSAALASLVTFDLDLVSEVDEICEPYLVGLHMVRVTAVPSCSASPAPEGRHRDGHRFVVMHLIAREGCVGGTSRVYAESGALLTTTMTQFLDTVVVDDWRVEHEVDPIAATGPSGWRDTLLVDFDHAPFDDRGLRAPE